MRPLVPFVALSTALLVSADLSASPFSTNSNSPVHFSADAFWASPQVINAADDAAAPAGYVNTASGGKIWAAGDGALGFVDIEKYDTDICGSLCDQICGCSTFQIYYEQDANTGVPVAKCSFWAGTVSAKHVVHGALNVIGACNVYSSNKIVPPIAFQAPQWHDNLVLDHVADRDANHSYIASTDFPDGSFDISRCADYTVSHGGKYFNTYMVHEDGSDTTQTCDCYTHTVPQSNAAYIRPQGTTVISHSFSCETSDNEDVEENGDSLTRGWFGWDKYTSSDIPFSKTGTSSPWSSSTRAPGLSTTAPLLHGPFAKSTSTTRSDGYTLSTMSTAKDAISTTATIGSMIYTTPTNGASSLVTSSYLLTTTSPTSDDTTTISSMTTTSSTDSVENDQVSSTTYTTAGTFPISSTGYSTSISSSSTMTSTTTATSYTTISTAENEGTTTTMSTVSDMTTTSTLSSADPSTTTTAMTTTLEATTMPTTTMTSTISVSEPTTTYYYVQTGGISSRKRVIQEAVSYLTVSNGQLSFVDTQEDATPFEVKNGYLLTVDGLYVGIPAGTADGTPYTSFALFSQPSQGECSGWSTNGQTLGFGSANYPFSGFCSEAGIFRASFDSGSSCAPIICNVVPKPPSQSTNTTTTGISPMTSSTITTAITTSSATSTDSSTTTMTTRDSSTTPTESTTSTTGSGSTTTTMTNESTTTTTTDSTTTTTTTTGESTISTTSEGTTTTTSETTTTTSGTTTTTTNESTTTTTTTAESTTTTTTSESTTTTTTTAESTTTTTTTTTAESTTTTTTTTTAESTTTTTTSESTTTTTTTAESTTTTTTSESTTTTTSESTTTTTTAESTTTTTTAESTTTTTSESTTTTTTTTSESTTTTTMTGESTTTTSTTTTTSDSTSTTGDSSTTTTSDSTTATSTTTTETSTSTATSTSESTTTTTDFPTTTTTTVITESSTTTTSSLPETTPPPDSYGNYTGGPPGNIPQGPPFNFSGGPPFNLSGGPPFNLSGGFSFNFSSSPPFNFTGSPPFNFSGHPAANESSGGFDPGSFNLTQWGFNSTAGWNMTGWSANITNAFAAASIIKSNNFTGFCSSLLGYTTAISTITVPATITIAVEATETSGTLTSGTATVYTSITETVKITSVPQDLKQKRRRDELPTPAVSTPGPLAGFDASYLTTACMWKARPVFETATAYETSTTTEYATTYTTVPATTVPAATETKVSTSTLTINVCEPTAPSQMLWNPSFECYKAGWDIDSAKGAELLWGPEGTPDNSSGSYGQFPGAQGGSGGGPPKGPSSNGAFPSGSIPSGALPSGGTPPGGAPSASGSGGTTPNNPTQSGSPVSDSESPPSRRLKRQQQPQSDKEKYGASLWTPDYPAYDGNTYARLFQGGTITQKVSLTAGAYWLAYYYRIPTYATNNEKCSFNVSIGGMPLMGPGIASVAEPTDGWVPSGGFFFVPPFLAGKKKLEFKFICPAATSAQRRQEAANDGYGQEYPPPDSSVLKDVPIIDLDYVRLGKDDGNWGQYFGPGNAAAANYAAYKAATGGQGNGAGSPPWFGAGFGGPPSGQFPGGSPFGGSFGGGQGQG